MEQSKRISRKVISALLSLLMVFSCFSGMSLTAYAADEVSENISLVASSSANLKTISGTHYSVSCGYMCANDSGMQVCKSGALTINARKGETITKVVLTYSWGNNKSSLSASAGTFDGNATISDINAQQVTISSSNTAGVKISAVTVYFEGSLSNPTVTLTGGANAKSSGGLLTQSYLPGAMDTVTYTALTGAAFPEFETFTQNGVTVKRTSDTVVTVSGTPTANTEITVPDAESSSKIVTWGSSIINDSGRQIRTNNSYSDTANGITLTKSGSGYASLDNGDWMTSGDVTLNFTTATGKFTSIEIETSQIYDGGNWTKDGNTLKWNGTPSNSVSLSGSGLFLEGVSSINFVIEMPTVSVTITPGSNMTKTETSGAASQTGLTGAMTDVVYTADDGYYFPTDYSVAEVSGIKVTRDSYTQITVSGTPSADAEITLTAPTAKTTPDAPTAAATDCTTADNNDGKLTGVTAEMEYKKSDATEWTAGTGSDITGLVPGTYYVRVKATETTNASANQELTIKGFISYTVTFKVVNGKWNEGEGDAATADKTVTLTGYEGDTLKLAASQIPTVGTKPNDTYKAGSWDVTPSTETEITAATTYTYTYAQKDSISQTVTFKVVNGSWDDETTADKTVTLTGYEGDTLKLTADQIPAVGSKPNDTYKAGSWDVTPSTETAITEATTYTYTYAAKEASVVTKAPEAKTLTYNGSAQELVTAGEATGGEMQYALGDANGATQPYTTSIPTKTDAGTYYVWYKIAGDENHNETEPACVEITINKANITPTVSLEGWTYGQEANAPSVSGNTGNGAVTYTYATKGSDNFSATVPTNAGNYTVKATIAATANYSGGTATADFTIAKANITPTVSIDGWTYNQTAKTPSVSGNSGNGTVTYTYATKGSDSFSATVPTNAGNYTVKATIAATTNYNGATATAGFTITKADPTYTVPTGLTATYGQTLANVTLPTGWAWADSTQSVGTVGTNTFKANFTPADTANYNTVSGVDVTVTVGKAAGKDAVISTDTMAYNADSIYIEGVAGQEYVIVPKGTAVTDADWNTSVKPDPERDNWVFFENLNAATEYEIYTRTAETDTAFASDAVKADVYTTLSCIGYLYDSTLVGASITVEPDPNVEGLTYKWYQDEVTEDGEGIIHHNLTEIPGATGSSYTFREEDAGKRIAVKIFAGDSEVGDVATDTPVALTAKVIFESNGGSDVETLTDAAYQSKIKAPADPTREGFAFDGWYWDEEFETPFDFEKDVITWTETTLYAKWTPNDYKITSVTGLTGANNKQWTKGTKDGVVITVKVSGEDDSFDHFVGVKLDGVELVIDVDYTVKKGSTIVTLTPATLEKLTVGEHTVTVLFNNGEVNTTLTVLAASGGNATSPQTGDNSHLGLWIALMMFSLLGIAASLIFGRKKRVFDR